MHCYIVHIVPPICAVVLMIISNTVMIRRHCVGVIYLGLIYGYLNYRGTVIKGEPLYWFLTWEDYTSMLVLAAFIAVFVVIF